MKKYCALKRLDCLGKCNFSCQSCVWSMSASDLDAYADRQETNLLEIKSKGSYQHYKGAK